MEERGLSGWVAVLGHALHRHPFLDVMMVHHFGVPRGSFDEAVAALRARHEATLETAA